MARRTEPAHVRAERRRVPPDRVHHPRGRGARLARDGHRRPGPARHLSKVLRSPRIRRAAVPAGRGGPRPARGQPHGSSLVSGGAHVDLHVPRVGAGSRRYGEASVEHVILVDWRRPDPRADSLRIFRTSRPSQWYLTWVAGRVRQRGRCERGERAADGPRHEEPSLDGGCLAVMTIRTTETTVGSVLLTTKDGGALSARPPSWCLPPRASSRKSFSVHRGTGDGLHRKMKDAGSSPPLLVCRPR